MMLNEWQQDIIIIIKNFVLQIDPVHQKEYPTVSKTDIQYSAPLNSTDESLLYNSPNTHSLFLLNLIINMEFLGSG